MPAKGRKPAVTLDDYNALCRSLPHTTHVVQLGGAHVWKVAGKVFAIAGWQDEGDDLFVTFKVSKIAFEALKDEPGLRPAPYLASRGMSWIQRTDDQTMDDKALMDHVRTSHRIVASSLPKKTQRELGLEPEAQQPAKFRHATKKRAAKK